MTEIFIIICLIILNGLFAMAEIALVSARKARLEAQANKGDRRAKEALQLSNKPQLFMSTTQIGITLIGILTGIFSGAGIKESVAAYIHTFPSLSDYSNGIATFIVVLIITFFSLVIGELVPKQIGLSNPEGIAKTVAAPMRIISVFTYPFIWLLSHSSNFIVKLFGIKNNNNQVTEEEIKALISEGTEQGAIEEAEQEIIERVFHLGDRNITSLMTHRSDTIWLDVNTTLADLKKLEGEQVHSVYPVCDGNIDKICGMASLKEIFWESPEKTLKEIMVPAIYVPENNTAYQLLEKFKQTKRHSAIIVDEYGSMQGIITLNDILDAIVGDIPEQDEENYEIIKRSDDTYFIDAQIPFYNFLSYFDKVEWLDYIDQDFDTLAGFLLHQMKRIPTAGEKLHWRGFDFEIADMDNHRIDKLLVKFHEEDNPENNVED
ncbi:MAG: HlyC/CorC family transporter [Bacteroidetes bacterium]|nr:HlyC/CorC family transporter [Bacteroidota bacterium]